ncbi:hypothetical protein B0H15DRAFT_423465 [Mycena belliarum]|uniref:Uncharacterized protein n=1 Tax=Mycena belliarum TaxID=1033014 RepID=A0AAD6XP72_9AGAR|nr:hypothetical protein B0H15DRAFT_423465 [Mycena belliae]
MPPSQQQRIDIPLDPELLDAVLPNTTHEERVKSFSDVLNAEGSVDAAIALYKRHYECVKTGAVIGATRPPPYLSEVIHMADVGPLRLFYHSTYPARLHANSPFSWNLYIGRADQGLESIMPDWEAQGIHVEVPNLLGRWERCGALTILPSTRVRITYRSGTSRDFKEEIILPGGPKDAHFPVRLLPPVYT